MRRTLTDYLGSVLDAPISRLRRQAISIAICVAGAIGAIFYAASAATLALEPQVGAVYGRLIIAGRLCIAGDRRDRHSPPVVAAGNHHAPRASRSQGNAETGPAGNDHRSGRHGLQRFRKPESRQGRQTLSDLRKQKGAASMRRLFYFCRDQPTARRSLRLALRSKNSAWLTTADTVAGWNGLAIRKAGSGRSPVRKRSG